MRITKKLSHNRNRKPPEGYNGCYPKHLEHILARVWSRCCEYLLVSMEALSKAFLLFFLLPDWIKLNHLKSPLLIFLYM